MKNVFLRLLTVIAITGSIEAQSLEKETVSAFLETKKGVRHDLKLKFETFELSTLTVEDSVQILNSKYQKKKTTKLSDIDKQIASLEKRINTKKEIKSAFDKAVESSLQKRYKYDIEKLKAKREKAENWTPKYLNRYTEVSDKNKSLVKKVNSIFYAQKPWEKISKKYRGTFILSLDGKKCYKMIPYPKKEQ